ncbi:sulfatase [Paenibacillus sp. CAA11]|uniref:LTA synthase family protein n=1 Tax=Paenibacillus sp. CAA11 TaxID=1532905 RepID=UPI000D34C0C7|nr:LTA synthase family protein [Paenibacillus sp. CAA11]AWB46783.1 sulfatase [Paenibacillus sp. CAA11]
MIVKSYLAWMAIFDGIPPLSPLLKEIPFIWIIFCLIEWFASKRKMAYYLAVNLLLTGIFFAAIMYYKYYGVIVDYRALQQVNQVTAVKNSVFSLLDPYYLLIFLDILVIGFLVIRGRKTPRVTELNKRRVRSSVVSTVFVLSLALCIFNIWPNRASMNEIKKAESMGILNYEAYTILSNKKEELVDMSKITQPAIDKLKGTTEPVAPKYQGVAKGKNLIILQLESFQNFLINLKIDGQEITPNMNKLVSQSLYFDHFYQMVGQGNTSDAEFVVNTSFYIPPNEAATQNYPDKQLPSLPRLMQENGYDTATFHTNVVNFWNRGELYKALGWNRYYDQEFYGKEDMVFFGPSDEVLYKKTMPELQKMQQSGKPFYAQIISMSSHHPFTIPHEKDKITLPERYQDTMVGDYLRAQNYADYCLGLFIEDLKAKGLYDNSVIVLYGDHQGLPKYSLDKDEKALMEEIYGRTYGNIDMINIPLVISVPGQQPAKFNQVGGEVDIMPTVANLLGISLQNHIHFGQDILNQDYNLLPQRYYLPSGSFLNDKALFMPGVWYDDGDQIPLSGNGVNQALTTENEYNRALDLLHLSDSYVKQLPNRVDK